MRWSVERSSFATKANEITEISCPVVLSVCRSVERTATATEMARPEPFQFRVGTFAAAAKQPQCRSGQFQTDRCGRSNAAICVFRGGHAPLAAHHAHPPAREYRYAQQTKLRSRRRHLCIGYESSTAPLSSSSESLRLSVAAAR